MPTESNGKQQARQLSMAGTAPLIMIGSDIVDRQGSEVSKHSDVQRNKRAPRGRNAARKFGAKARSRASLSPASVSSVDVEVEGKNPRPRRVKPKLGTSDAPSGASRTDRVDKNQRSSKRRMSRRPSVGNVKSEPVKTAEHKHEGETLNAPAQSAASKPCPEGEPQVLVTPVPPFPGDAARSEVITALREEEVKEVVKSQWTTIRYPAGEVVVDDWALMLHDMLPACMKRFLPEPLKNLQWAEIKLPTDLYNRALMRFSGKQARNSQKEYEQVSQEYYSGVFRHPLCKNIDMRAAVTALLYVTFDSSLAMQRTFEVYMRSRVDYIEQERANAAIGSRLSWRFSWPLRTMAVTALVASGTWLAMKAEISDKAKRVGKVAGGILSALLVGGMLSKGLLAGTFVTGFRKRKAEEIEVKPLVKQVGNYVYPDFRLVGVAGRPAASWSLAHFLATQDAGRFDTSDPMTYFTGPPPERKAVTWKAMITTFDAPMPTRVVDGVATEFVEDVSPCADGDYTPSLPYYAVGPCVTPMVPCLFDTNAPVNLRSCIVKHFSIDHRTRDADVHVFDDGVADRSYEQVMEILKTGAASRAPSTTEEYMAHLTAKKRAAYETHVLVGREDKRDGKSEKRHHRRNLFLKREFICKRDSKEGGTGAKVRGIVAYANQGWYFMDGPLCYNLLKYFAYPFVSLPVTSVVNSVSNYPVVCCASGSSPLQVGDWLYTFLKMAEVGYVAFAENDYSSYDSTQGAKSLKRTMKELKTGFVLTPDEERAWSGMVDKDIVVKFKNADSKRVPKFKFSAHGNMDSGCNGTTLFNSFSNSAVTRRAHMVAMNEIRGLGLCELYQMVLGDDNVLALVASESLRGKDELLNKYWKLIEREIKAAGYMPKLATPPSHALQFCSQVFAPVIITETKVGPQGQKTPYSRESRILVPNVNKFLHKFGWCHTALTRWTETECAAYLRDVCIGEPRLAFVPILRILHAHYSNLNVELKRGAENVENLSWKIQEKEDVVNITPFGTDDWFYAVYDVTQAEVESCETLLTEALLANPVGQFYFNHPVIAKMCEQEPLVRQA